MDQIDQLFADLLKEANTKKHDTKTYKVMNYVLTEDEFVKRVTGLLPGLLVRPSLDIPQNMVDDVVKYSKVVVTMFPNQDLLTSVRIAIQTLAVNQIYDQMKDEL